MNKLSKIKLFWVLLAGLILLSGCRPKEVESTVMAMQRQNFDDALQFAEKAVQTYPENAEAWFYYGFLLGEHKKDYVGMNKAFDKVLSLNPAQKVSFAGGQVAAKDAINQIRLAKFAENYNGGVKLIQEGQNTTDEAQKKEYYAKAKEKLELATKITPERPEPYRPLAMTSIFLGDTTGAEKALQMGLERLPNDEMMVIAAAEVYTMTGNFDKAEEMLKKALEINPNNSDAYQKLGLLEANRKNWDKANEYYQKAMALDPDNVDLAYNIGVSLYNQHKTDDALPYFLKAYQAEPDNEIITNILANCYVRTQNRVDEGIEFMKTLTEKYPDNPTYWEYLAILYGNKGMSKEANEAFKKSQELKKN